MVYENVENACEIVGKEKSEIRINSIMKKLMKNQE